MRILHMELVSQDLDPRALIDELLKFVRTAPLGEFRLRLKLSRLSSLSLLINGFQRILWRIDVKSFKICPF